MKLEVVGKAKIINTTYRLSKRGSTQTYYDVQCSCGTIRRKLWALSWGGNGWYICPGCKCRVSKNLDVVRFINDKG